MPTIMTPAEADYLAAYNDYMAARAGFYAGTVTPEAFINLRKAMEAKGAEWDAERNAA